MIARSLLLNQLAENWWAIALRGVLAIAFGVLAFLWPGLTLIALVFLWGAFAFVDGAFAIASGLRDQDGQGRNWTMVLVGAIGIVAGILAFAIPDITAIALVLLIGAWSLVRGVFEIVVAWQIRREVRDEWVLAVDGIVSVLFGLAVLIFPGAGALALVWAIAAFAIISGVILLVVAFRLRSFRDRHATPGFRSDRGLTAA
jgi:uncharacterized membrane protein HdeD (DUF308 family)